MLGLEAHRRCQPVLEQDTWLECVVMFGLHSALGVHRSRIASQPVMGELPQRIPEDVGGMAVLWGGHCSHCLLLPAAEQG